MRAVVVTKFCTPQDLHVSTVDPPALPADGVRIDVHAAGVNFADTLIIAGRYQEKPPFPFVPGFEVAGVVTELGPEAAVAAGGIKAGDPVFAVVDQGGFAEQVVARAADVHPLPHGMDFTTAAGFPIAYGTSHFSLVDRARLRPGETVLVHGAAGGVGLTAVECAKAVGATVIATAGGARKLEVARAHGADHCIDYKAEDIRARVKELTGGRGVDVVYDPVGGDIFDASLRCTAPDGRLLVIGFAAGTIQQIPANYLLVKNLSVLGVYYGAYRRLAPARVRDSFAELKRWFEAGRLRPHVSQTYPLDQVGTALQALKDRTATGKVVLLPR